MFDNLPDITIHAAAPWSKIPDAGPVQVPSWIKPAEPPPSLVDPVVTVKQPERVVEPVVQAPVVVSPAEPPAPPGGRCMDDDPAIPTRDYEAEIAALEGQLKKVIQSVAQIRSQLVSECERDAVQLAIVIAEKIVGRELTTDPALIASWVEAGFDALAGDDQLVVISPDVAQAVPSEAWTNGQGQPIVPTVDSSLPPGSCEIRGEHSRLDASLTARFAALIDAMDLGDDKD